MKAIVLEGLEHLKSVLLSRFPKETRKAMRLACSDAARSAQSKGNRIARDAYTAKSKKKVRAKVKQTGEHASVLFTGEVGEPLRHFDLRPRKPGSRPPEGISVRVKKGGAYRHAKGPEGQKTFLFRSGNGSVILGYRKSKKDRSISTEGLMAASPIQAVAKKENSERLAERAGEKGKLELLRQLGRVLKGEIR